MNTMHYATYVPSNPNLPVEILSTEGQTQEEADNLMQYHKQSASRFGDDRQGEFRVFTAEELCKIATPEQLANLGIAIPA